MITTVDNMEPCISCGFYFNLKKRRPNLLPCAHSMCTVCFDELSGSGEIKCPVHSVTYPANISSDIEKEQLLEAWRVPCFFHLSEDAERVCIVHALPLCEYCADCGDRENSCDLKDLVGEGPDDIRVLLRQRVEDDAELKLSRLSDEMRMAYQGIRQLPLKDLLSTSRKIFKKLNPKVCRSCSISNVQYCNLDSFTLLCERCVSSADSAHSIQRLSDIDFSLECYSQYLHRVASIIHFYELNIEGITSLQPSSLDLITRIVNVREIMRMRKMQPPERNPFQMDKYFVCPSCRESSKQKDIAMLWRLPCAGALHAVCQECAERMEAEQECSVTCPLDFSSYPIPESQMKVILRNPEDSLTDESTIDTVSKEIIGDGHFLAHRGYVIPPFSSREFEAVERYRRVLPACFLGEIISKESKQFAQPWIINKVPNQVEAISFEASRAVVLYGLTFANPKGFGDVATVSWVRIYVGVSAVGEPYDCTLQNCELCGGKISTDVYFGDKVQDGVHYGAGVQIPANMPVTLKLRLDTAGGKGLAMYHGNHVGRYRDCRGPSGTEWKFLMTTAVEPGEVSGGQHDIISPILRLIYRNVEWSG